MKRPLDLLREKAAQLQGSWPHDRPTFDLQTGWCDSYDELFESEFTTVCGEQGLLALILKSGRAILSGRGGSGKTRLLRRLYRKALDAEILPVYIDLKLWSGADYEEWQRWTANDPVDGTAFLLNRFGNLEAGALELDRLPPSTRKLVIVDGLNEMAATVGTQILALADDLVRSQMNTSVIVADRLIRRELPNASRWRIGSTLPLTDAEVRKHLGEDTKISDQDTRTSPFFLNVELERKSQDSRDGRAAVLKLWLQEHSTLSEQELDEGSSAAFSMYVDQASRSRIFPTSAFAALTSKTTMQKLESSGVLVTVGGDSYFEHHIVHDFLASRKLAALDPKHWQPHVFRKITFDSSIDPLELTFEQLDVQRGEHFLRALYDWQLYAAGYVLSYAGDVGFAVSREMRTVICAMLAEKRFDAIIASRERALDALRLIRTPEAQAFRDTKSIPDICHLLEDVPEPSGWFREWRRVYCVSSSKELTAEMLGAIRQADSVIGWTIANVARRFPDLNWAVPVLEEILKTDDSPTVRWRAAHALGKVFAKESVKVLVAAVRDDDDIDVKFGSVRALVEFALGTDAGTRALVKADLDSLASTISEQPRLSRELRSCLLMDSCLVPADWLDFVRGCVRTQFVLAESLAEKDVWRGCLFAAEDLYLPTAKQGL